MEKKYTDFIDKKDFLDKTKRNAKLNLLIEQHLKDRNNAINLRLKELGIDFTIEENDKSEDKDRKIYVATEKDLFSGIRTTLVFYRNPPKKDVSLLIYAIQHIPLQEDGTFGFLCTIHDL